MSDAIIVRGYVIPRDRRYTRTDEWAKREGDIVIVGITDYAQKKLRDIIGVELPEPGVEVEAGEAVASIESVKAAADVYAPVSGTIVEVNRALEEHPELINMDPYGKGWMFKIRMRDASEWEKLLTPEEYARKIEKEESEE